MLGELQPLRLIDGLQTQRLVFALGQFVKRCGHDEVLPAGRPSTRQARLLIRPSVRRPGVLVIAEILEIRLDVLVPPAVLAMEPALLRVKRIVAVPAGIEREPGRVTSRRVVGSVVVAVVVVAVAWPQEEVAGAYGRARSPSQA